MTYSERKEKEKYLLHLIKKERLISLEKVAYDCECSKRTIMRIISSLRNEGYNIKYCRTKCRYLIME